MFSPPGALDVRACVSAQRGILGGKSGWHIWTGFTRCFATEHCHCERTTAIQISMLHMGVGVWERTSATLKKTLQRAAMKLTWERPGRFHGGAAAARPPRLHQLVVALDRGAVGNPRSRRGPPGPLRLRRPDAVGAAPPRRGRDGLRAEHAEGAQRSAGLTQALSTTHPGGFISTTFDSPHVLST
jgi:hypothetical protein